ncbi:peptidylprolyl isomerase [Psychroserpens burtonensis]|uniref:Peptidylprolyl isomerase n=1 Tax=Psychroserpens burtonensis TaxID=49278 RepID=A0A5C7B574_9FLAO|nr:peptidylprolyl isomerase [Psychroserpens burtonensis]TXE16882.1 peptidylprolyl isomerase [Psychroserpens burtonensis]
MKLLVTIVCFCFTFLAQAQVKKDDVLFTVAGDAIMASEFVRVYNKNLDLVKDESQKDIDAYLELFVNYQLKVKEARRLGLDEDAKYIGEFNNYKTQLTKNFMSDNKVTDALVKEAYDRTTSDVKVSHILVRLDESVSDTLAVYNKVLKLRERLINDGFEAVKKEVHDGKTIFAEDLGYFGGFKMVYPFETAAFNTPVGEVSMPFRTRFGYHVVKVFEKRQSLGEVTVAHIMISTKQNDSTVDPEARINQIYKKLEQGEKFESLAKQFSEDKSSSKKGGVLTPIVGGQLRAKEFEDVAFSLEKKDDVSRPFKTDYGWHIVKLISKKGIQPFEEVKNELENKVKRDSRSALINSALVKKLMTKYKVKVFKDEGLAFMETILNDGFFKQSWKTPKDIKEGVLITIRDTQVSYKDFADYLMSNLRKYNNQLVDYKALLTTEFDAFLEQQVLKYHEDNLEFENEDFAFVLKEYRDGLLLFDLMEKEVWNAAVKDSVGLEKFYNDNTSNYVWRDRVDAVIFSSASKTTIETVKTELQKDISAENIMVMINKDENLNVISTANTFEESDQVLPQDFEFKEGVSNIYKHNESYHVILVNNVLPAKKKTIEEARGKVISDYQNYIETNWVKLLRERFGVEVNKRTLKRVKKQILKNN